MTLMAELLRQPLIAYIHNNNIRPDFLNIFKGNAVIRFRIKEIQKLIATGYHDHTDLSAAFVEFKVTNPSQLLAVLQINHIFAFQFRKEHIFFLSIFFHYLLYVVFS